MTGPVCAKKFPAVLDLEPGTYHWCSCGRSMTQPFCDGSHAGTDFTPVKFTLDKPMRLALCQCKRTGHALKCDGTHKLLP